jgi:hypothetical protein
MLTNKSGEKQRTQVAIDLVLHSIIFLISLELKLGTRSKRALVVALWATACLELTLSFVCAGSRLPLGPVCGFSGITVACVLVHGLLHLLLALRVAREGIGDDGEHACVDS